MASDKRTAFVTGGTGFLGINIIDALLAEGWAVTALHRTTSDLKYLSQRDVTLVPGNIVEPKTLEGVIPEGVDAVFHAAASLNLWSRGNDLQTLINVEGTRHMAEAALKAGAKRFVHTSSISAYGMQRGKIAEDAEQLGRVSWVNYQKTKYLAEEEVRAAVKRGLDAVILNPCNIIGAYDTTGWACILLMLDDGSLPGVPPGSNSFCHAGAVARAHVAAADKGRTGENYLLGGIDDSYHAMVTLAGKLLGKPVPRKPIAPWVLRTVARIGAAAAFLTGKEPKVTPEAAGLVTRHLFADCSKAVAELGYEVVPLEAMLQESIDWLRAEGHLPPVQG